MVVGDGLRDGDAMPWVALCDGKECPQREQCARYTYKMVMEAMDRVHSVPTLMEPLWSDDVDNCRYWWENLGSLQYKGTSTGRWP